MQKLSKRVQYNFVTPMNLALASSSVDLRCSFSGQKDFAVARELVIDQRLLSLCVVHRSSARTQEDIVNPVRSHSHVNGTGFRLLRAHQLCSFSEMNPYFFESGYLLYFRPVVVFILWCVPKEDPTKT